MIIPKELADTLQELNGTYYGQALRQVLEMKKNEWNNVKTIESWEETQARKFAIIFIDELFSFMEQKKVETKSKNQYT
jgi:hypothetical protein